MEDYPETTPTQQSGETMEESTGNSTATAAEEASAPSVDATPPEPTPETPDTEALIAEAEQRGYLRGLNEQIARHMQQPALWENERRPPAEPSADTDGDYASLFLSALRPGVWD